MIYDSLSYCEVKRLPTTTFFNLPAEKRDKFLSAARAEFARVPYADVSINRIIREAGIPRGSFYMYFKDREELLRFLLFEYGSRMAGFLEAALLQQHGDLFAAFLSIFDSILHSCSCPGCDGGFQPLISIFRHNAGLHFHMVPEPELMLERLIPHIDKSLLDLKSEADLRDMFAVLMGITASALCGGMHGSNPAAARARFINLLDILKRGMSAPSISHC
jgi:AcrR family transcriptional regulator